MTTASPFYLGSRNGIPHHRFVDTRSNAMNDPDFEHTQPSMPAPFYGTATGQHRHLPPPSVRPARLLILAIALVGLCAVPIIFFVK
jgi:hypothetical protein